MIRASLLATSGLLLAACGGSAMAPDVAAYKKLTQDISTAVESHRMACAALTPSDCPAEKTRYEGVLRPMLEHMDATSSGMDDCMHSMGHSQMADLQSTCRSMSSEFDAHLSSACVADVAGEANRHAAAMNGLLKHELDACDSMHSMMGGMMSGGSCHH